DDERDGASLVSRGETNGGLSLVWISYFRINLDAGASVLGRALERHFVQSASPHRPPSGKAATHLPGGQPGPRAQRYRQGLRVSQGRVRHHRSRRDQEDRAEDGEDDGDPRIREVERRGSGVLRVVVLHGSR